ncbi:unnamed protein product [Linum trigynum]|uniref:Uncharacterized protein n=1 Tax=Linum trigynum TaxID=586398 RepID=A0AAV2CE31_9ROSI
MIPIGSSHTSPLLEEEAVSNYMTSSEFWLSIETESGSLLWGLVSLEWFNGNAVGMAPYEDKVFLYSVMCLGARGEVQKAVYQTFKHATLTAQNCQNSTKSGSKCRKAGLELISRRWKRNQVWRIVPHGSLRFLIQKRGIG